MSGCVVALLGAVRGLLAIRLSCRSIFLGCILSLW
jgi:hypothetical protein